MKKIHKNVIIGKNAFIDDFVIIGRPPKGKKDGELKTIIGDNAVIRAHTIIYAGNKIGNNFTTGHHVLIRDNNQIADNVLIGSYSSIDYNTKIGNNVKLRHNVFIPEYTIIEDNVWLGPSVTILNTPHPLCPLAKKCYSEYAYVTIKKDAIIGASATIGPNLIIGERSLVGFGSVVTKDVPPNTVVAGNPAKIIKKVDDLKCFFDLIERPYQILEEPIKQIKLVDIKREYDSIQPDIDDAIKKIIDSSSYIMGSQLKEFENNFAKFNNSSYCIGTSSGTSALHLALLIVGIKPGDEVITVPNTFIATTETISQTGAKVKFADIYEDDYTIDPSKIKVSKKTKAIIPVHLYGHPCNLDPILEIAEKHNLIVIEDAAQAHGTLYKNKNVGNFGLLSIFSFFPAKILGAYGDAGAIVTNNEELAEKARLLLNHGRKEKYLHLVEGYNYRMDTLQAAILNAKLNYLEKWIEKRRQLAKLYNKLLPNGIIKPIEKEYAKHSYYMYIIRHSKRDNLKDFLAEKNIETGIHYPIPLHLQPAYKYLKYKKGSFPISEKVSKEILSLPLFPELREDEVNFIVENINKFLNQK